MLPEQRSAALVEARSWIGTPYHHMGRVKGVGADCATFPAEVYAAVGAIPPLAIDYYPPDWHLHRGEEKYLARVLEHAHAVSAPEPGDFALWRVGRAFAHGAIVLAWPRIVHAAAGIGVIEDDGTSPALAFGRRGGAGARRDVRFFSPFS
jgi:cell wall-associated NlpC family hydrolase